MALQLTCRPAKRSGPCAHCGKGESSQWRVGPPNAPTLCNACGVCWGRKKKLPQVAGRSPCVSASAAELDRAVAPPVPASAPPRPRLGGQAAAVTSVNELAAVLLALSGGEAENYHGEVHSVAPPSCVPPQRRRSSTARSDRLLQAEAQPRCAGRPVEDSPGQASKRQRTDADGAVPAAVPHWVVASAQLAHAPPTPMLGCTAAAAAPGGGVEVPVAPLMVTPLYAPPRWLFPPAFPPASMQPHGTPLLPAAGLFVAPSIKAV